MLLMVLQGILGGKPSVLEREEVWSRKGKITSEF